jgi:hypothetical protein
LAAKFNKTNDGIILATNKEVYVANIKKNENLKIGKVNGWKG